LISTLPLSADEKNALLETERNERRTFTRLLISRGLITPESLRKAYETYCGIPPYGGGNVELPEILPVPFLRSRLILPVSAEDSTLVVAMADPLDMDGREAIAKAAGRRVEVQAGTEEEIREAIEKTYGEGVSSMERLVEQVTEEGEEGPGDERVERLIGAASEAPIIRLVNLIVARGIERGASDIHLEPYEKSLLVRYRIDGILEDVESPPKRLQTAIISRIKIMARLNIAESRLPQDGRVKLRIHGQEIDFRVSTVPTLFGESVVIRILDQAAVPLNLSRLGFPPDTLDGFRRMLAVPHGMILVTGPTGSGKTTTLYGALQEIRSSERKIITIEDPVEYQIAGVNQIQVKPQIGLTFASGLRSIVRQDPDVILVGEIRDRETAEIAIHSALTGHLVLSTLHTNDSAGAVARLLEMGVEEYLLPSSLMGVLAQRLVRTICERCSSPRDISPVLREELLKEAGFAADGNQRLGKGCDSCGGTGYRGRVGIFELLPMDQDIKDLVLARSDSGTIRERAIARGMTLLRDDGWEKTRRGITTIEEVLRVTRAG
jgi:general secretion pathway protein E